MSDDDALRTRLRRADPVASLGPTDPDRVSRLLEDAMGPDTPTESRATGTRGRSALTWLVAAAAVVLVGLAATYLVVRDPTSAPVENDTLDTLELALPGEEAAGRCMVPNPDVLGRAQVAFDGEVVSVSEGRVVLRPSRFYAGGPADQVEVAQASESLQDLVLGVRFEEGGRYLVAANGGDVMVCGFSGVHDAERQQLYEAAFPE